MTYQPPVTGDHTDPNSLVAIAERFDFDCACFASHDDADAVASLLKASGAHVEVSCGEYRVFLTDIEGYFWPETQADFIIELTN